jgi:hypothetical protein
VNSMWPSSFETSKILSPRDIVAAQCQALSDATGGLVYARISDYSGKIKSDKAMSHIFDALWSASSIFPTEQPFDVQSVLGDNASGSHFTYEFFITSKSTPNYMYRVFFLKHKLDYYPLEIVLDNSISQELGSRENVVCSSQEEFIGFLGDILKSNRMKFVVSSLLAMNKA